MARGPTHRAPRWERISALDASNLRRERHGLPMTVAALALVEAGPLLDPGGQVSLQAVRRHVEARTSGVPRLRQVATGWRCG